MKLPGDIRLIICTSYKPLRMEELRATIQQHKQSRAIHFEQLYESTFPKVAAFVSKMNGSFEDAKDIFQDALVIFFEKTTVMGFVCTSEEAYIMGIAKHLWVRKFQQDRQRVLFDHFEQQLNVPSDITLDVNTTRLLRLLETAGKKCMDLLSAMYYDDIPLKQITRRHRYRNEHTASVQKYKCLEKVRDTVKNKSISYEQFID